MLAQVGGNQQAGNIEGLQVQHPLRRGLGILVVAETDIGSRQVSVDRCIVRVVEVQVLGLIPGSSKFMLIEQESHMCFSQLKILRGETEAGSDGLRCLAIVVRRRGLVRAADERPTQDCCRLRASWGRTRSAAWRLRFVAQRESLAGFRLGQNRLKRR